MSRSHPRKRVKVLAADKGYDSKDLRKALGERGIRPQLPRASQENKKKSGQTHKNVSPSFSNRALRAHGFNALAVGSLFDLVRISACFNAFVSLATKHIWINRILLVG